MGTKHLHQTWIAIVVDIGQLLMLQIPKIAYQWAYDRRTVLVLVE